jgi:uncharacterized protein YifE (UPF0438 family)
MKNGIPGPDISGPGIFLRKGDFTMKETKKSLPACHGQAMTERDEDSPSLADDAVA